MKIQNFKLIKTSEYPTYDLKITLKPCFRCNHNCWFCHEYDNKTSMWTKDDCDLVIERLKDIPKDKTKLFFYLYGGEPTLSEHWEYLNYKILETFSDRDLFVQTQTNLSLDESRLKTFCKNVRGAPVDICSSYHLDKQLVGEFISKMDICNSYDVLGLCFVSTEIRKEKQFIREFYKIASTYPKKTKLKFTQLENLINTRVPKYRELLRDEYLRGNDKGESLEYRYFMRKYPDFKNYLEEGWNFNVDGTALNYSEVKEQGIYRQFKFMKCECGTKNLVIDHNLKVYHCNDYYYSQIEPTDIRDINFSEYTKRNIRCLNHKCTDGLDHTKYR